MSKIETEKKRINNIHNMDPILIEHIFLLPKEGPGRDDLKQLYAWTFDDAMNAQTEWETMYGPNVQGRGPFWRWEGAQVLKELFEVYQTGNNSAIIEALYVCSMNSLPIPYWCEKGCIAAYYKVRRYKAKSWDDVFERPHPKGTHLGAKREEIEKSILIYGKIRRLKETDPSIALDASFFESVGKEFGIGGKTKTEEYYYKWKNKIENKEY